ADTERRHDEGQDGETRVELRFGGGGNHNLFNSGTLPYVVLGVYFGLGPSRGDLSRRERGQNAIAGTSSRTDGAAGGEVSALAGKFVGRFASGVVAKSVRQGAPCLAGRLSDLVRGGG